MDIGKPVRTIFVPDSDPDIIEVPNWPTHVPKEEPILVPNWPTFVPAEPKQ